MTTPFILSCGRRGGTRHRGDDFIRAGGVLRAQVAHHDVLDRQRHLGDNSQLCTQTRTACVAVSKGVLFDRSECAAARTSRRQAFRRHMRRFADAAEICMTSDRRVLMGTGKTLTCIADRTAWFACEAIVTLYVCASDTLIAVLVAHLRIAVNTVTVKVSGANIHLLLATCEPYSVSFHQISTVLVNKKAAFLLHGLVTR